MLKRSLKRLLQRTLPGSAEALQRIYQRRFVRRYERALGLPRIYREFADRYGARVLDGPFRGMSYVPQAAGSALVPKLLGSYECELHGIIGEILAAEYPVIVDVGCAEGYYAVGLALRMHSAQIYAFDTDPAARKLCRSMARLNNVGQRVVVRGKCDVDRLKPLLTGRALLVCDCEGFEQELLCPDRVPGLRGADILVELHDHVAPALSQTVLGRFRATHDIRVVRRSERDPSGYPALHFLKEEDQRLALSEFRPEGQQWAFMRARSGPPVL